MKSRSLFVLAISAMLLSATAFAADKINLDGVKCLVNSKKAASADVSSKYKDGKVYFCCKGCSGKFAKNSKKFASLANHQLAATGQYKVSKCVLTGKPLNGATVVKISGVNVCFCCNGCKGKVAKLEGKEQIDLVFNDKAFAKGFVKK